MRKLLAALAVVLLALPAHAAAAEKDPSLVRTDKGPVKGTVTATHRTFQGIPFAAPPVGELRWRDPQPVKAWSAPRDATKPGPQCAQTGVTTEDCLYLNVTTPANPGRPRPVMVWIHGGSFLTGSGSIFDAHSLATKTGSVVVTINYRLGALGFFGYPGLEGSGAFGLADQQAALKWVQRNARAFGGDPHNVTLFGESAGGMSVCAQLTTPRTTGLFHKAIIQSGACALTFPAGGGTFESLFAPRETVQATGAKVDLGCTDIECLRKVDVAKLVAPAVGGQFNRPAFHTRALPGDPAAAEREGRFHRVPVLLGTTRDEATLFVVLQAPQPVPPPLYRTVIADLYGEQRADAIIAKYPLDGDADIRPEVAAIGTDSAWACQTATSGRLLAKRTDVHRYEFADRAAPMIFPGMPAFPYGAYHASELTYLFDFPVNFTPEQRKLSDYMIGAWGRFASTGDPGWRESVVRSLAPGKTAPVDFAAEHQCAFWKGQL
ncbi:carboxylesterase family protein [Lentzea tibetensis]|uniref:Carboxylic ester hydrolase n=1 Tax=Lentzea tibetensis TaxID=2591470 RepID=A0A563ERZ1_9PSEU|nr:carboxylesterase family protein [Lentzea tibetensis]TWP49631.1 carboxylesterase family protein [Lentzea tibetensis]